MPMTEDELLAAITEYTGDDTAKAAALAKALREKARPVAQVLLNAGAALAKDKVKDEVATLTAARDAATTERDEAKTALDDLKAKTPDVAAVEARLTTAFNAKLAKKDEEIGKTRETAKAALRKAVSAKFTSELHAKHGVDPDYASTVLGQKHADRIFVGDDFGVKVLQLGGSDPYDAADEDAAVALLAADTAKLAPPKFVNTKADSGGGAGGGGGGGGGRKTLEQLKEEKRSSGEYAM